MSRAALKRVEALVVEQFDNPTGYVELETSDLRAVLKLAKRAEELKLRIVRAREMLRQLPELDDEEYAVVQAIVLLDLRKKVRR